MFVATIRSMLKSWLVEGRRVGDARHMKVEYCCDERRRDEECWCRCTCVVAIALHRRDRDAYEVISSRWAQTSCRRDAFLRLTLDEQRRRYAPFERAKMVRQRQSEMRNREILQHMKTTERRRWQSITFRGV